MYHIRPYQLFALIDEPPARRIVNVAIPYRRGVGSLTLLELFVIMAASRIVGANRIFEFGTFLGGTTFNLALNLSEHGEIFTLDLGEDDANGMKQHSEDVALTEAHLTCRATLDFVGSSVSEKVRVLTGNSTTFDFSPWKGTIDLVFIDGGHDLETVKSDTENALQMISANKRSCVLWHDYRSPLYGDLTKYLDDLSIRLSIVHVADTMLCVWFNDPNNALLPQLLQRQT